MAPVPISRLNIESSGVMSGALTRSKTFRLRVSLREGGGCRFLHLDGEERSITLHEQIDFLLIVVAEEVERRSLSGVGEALVVLDKTFILKSPLSSMQVSSTHGHIFLHLDSMERGQS